MGTKWNAYGYDGYEPASMPDDCIWFQTAWAEPKPVIEALARRYPDITIEHEWANEDLGEGCGRRVYENGEEIEEYYPEGEVESVEYAASVWKYDFCDLGMAKNKTGTRYCVIKCFFSNIKRGGILLTQIAVGSLHMFSLPRGYSEGFTGWCKQIIAICFTTFMQTTLLLLGMITMQTHALLGLGVMLAANEVPRIAQQFGLDTSMRVNMMSAVHTTTTAINLGRAIAKK